MNSVWLHDVELAVLYELAGARQLFCFLDYDGTLAPFAPTPDQAIPMAGTIALLQQLAVAPGVQVALVSGRTIADLQTLLDVKGIYYVGVHGIEVRLPGGATQIAAEGAALRAALQTIKDEVQPAVATRRGVLLEDKGTALAWHYRLASPTDAAAARRAVTRVARAHRRRGVPIATTHGYAVIEVRSAEITKGRTVSALLATHAPEALALYIGDDITDEDAFVALPARSITIRVGPQVAPTRARYRIEDPGEVHRFLRLLCDRRRAAHRTTS